MPSATLQLGLTAPSTAPAGSNITYTITLENDGPDDAQAVNLTNFLPMGTTFVSQAQTSGPSFTLGTFGGQVSDTIATLANGTSASFTVVASIPATTPSNTLLMDSASVLTTTPLSSSSHSMASATTTVSSGSGGGGIGSGGGGIVWTGAAGDFLWDTAANWSTGSVPGSADDVSIGGTMVPIIADGTIAIHNLELDGILEVDGTFGANDVTLDGGALTGDGVFSVGGAMTWTGGAMSGTGTTLISSGADLVISGPSPLSLDGWTLDNAGTATWSGGDITASGAATVVNEASATFTLDGSPNFEDSSGTSTFVNEGTFTKSSDAGESDIGASFQNGDTGTVAVDGGMLGFGNGGASSGTFQLAPGAKLGVKGGVFGLGGFVVGTGELVVGTGFSTMPAQVSMNTNSVTVNHLVLLTGGTLAGPGEVTTANAFEWTGGTISGDMTVTVAEGASMSISGIDSKLIKNSKLINDGAATWSGGKLGLESDAELQNTGTITATGDLSLDVGFSSGTFKNLGGQFVKTSGSLLLNAQVRTTIGSTFTVQTGGAINFTGIGGYLEGSFTAAAGAQVSFAAGNWSLEDVVPDTMFSGDGGYILQGSAKFTIDTGDSVRAQNFAMQGGELLGDGDFGAKSFSWTGGKMSGTGRTYEKDGDVMTISSGSAGDGGLPHTIEQRTLFDQGTVEWEPSAGDILLTQGAQIIMNGDEGGGVFEAWANSTILEPNSTMMPGAVLVENCGEFIKPSDEYLGLQWTSVNVHFENDSGTVQVDGALVSADYEQTGGSTEVGGIGSFTIQTLPSPANPNGITAGSVDVSGVLSFAPGFTMWGGTYSLNGGSIQTNSGSSPGASGPDGSEGQLSLGPNATLSGSGTIYAQLYNYGVIAPSSGTFFGRIVVAGTYRQFNTGSLQLRFGGSGGNDSFQVSPGGLFLGDVMELGGTLQVTLVDGLMPSSGAEFNVFAYAGGLDTTDHFANSVLIGPAGNIAHQTKYNDDGVSFVMQ